MTNDSQSSRTHFLFEIHDFKLIVGIVQACESQAEPPKLEREIGARRAAKGTRAGNFVDELALGPTFDGGFPILARGGISCTN